MADSELVYAAMAAAQLNADAFATDVLAVSPERLRAWLDGDRPVHAAMRALCIGIADRPSLAGEILRDRSAVS